MSTNGDSAHDADYQMASAALNSLRTVAVLSCRNNDGELGSAIGHIAAHHPEQVPLLLTLAMIDVVLLSEATLRMADRIAQLTGQTGGEVLREYVQSR